MLSGVAGLVRIMKPIVSIVFAALTILQGKPAAAASCLDDVATFAIRICGDIATTGSSTVVDANGNIDANISNIIKKVVGGASTSINGHILYDTYVGVARDQLASVHFNDIDCRQKMVNVAVSQVCQTSLAVSGQTSALLVNIFGDNFEFNKTVDSNELIHYLKRNGPFPNCNGRAIYFRQNLSTSEIKGYYADISGHICEYERVSSVNEYLCTNSTRSDCLSVCPEEEQLKDKIKLLFYETRIKPIEMKEEKPDRVSKTTFGLNSELSIKLVETHYNGQDEAPDHYSCTTSILLSTF
jgi:hypothetical protein